MFSVAFEDYNSVQAVLIALPGDIQPTDGWEKFVLEFVLCWGLFLLIFAYNKWRLMLSQRPVLIEPEGRSRVSKQELKRPGKCASCSNLLKQFDSAVVFAHLTKPEQIANKLGSVQFIGWQCPKCKPHLTGSGIHIRAYIVNPYKFRECLTCQELTVECTTIETLIAPTIEKEGKRRISFRCHCCSYLEEIEQPLSRLYPSKRRHSSSSSSEVILLGNSALKQAVTDTLDYLHPYKEPLPIPH